MHPTVLFPSLGHTPALIGGTTLLVVIIGLIFASRKRLTVAEKNADAARTLEYLILAAGKGGGFALSFLKELQQLFEEVVENHPEHVLTDRLQWIITENMVILSPFYTSSEEQARDLLIPYQNQLAAIKERVANGDLLNAARIADRDFNWEQREYFSI